MILFILLFITSAYADMQSTVLKAVSKTENGTKIRKIATTKANETVGKPTLTALGIGYAFLVKKEISTEKFIKVRRFNISPVYYYNNNEHRLMFNYRNEF